MLLLALFQIQIELPGIRFDDFQIPPCEVCLKEGVIETTVRSPFGLCCTSTIFSELFEKMKPSVVFFGESLSDSVRDNSYVNFHPPRGFILPGPLSFYRFSRIESCDQLLVIGTTLATYSAFRYVFGVY